MKNVRKDPALSGRLAALAALFLVCVGFGCKKPDPVDPTPTRTKADQELFEGGYYGSQAANMAGVAFLYEKVTGGAIPAGSTLEIEFSFAHDLAKPAIYSSPAEALNDSVLLAIAETIEAKRFRESQEGLYKGVILEKFASNPNFFKDITDRTREGGGDLPFAQFPWAAGFWTSLPTGTGQGKPGMGIGVGNEGDGAMVPLVYVYVR